MVWEMGRPAIADGNGTKTSIDFIFIVLYDIYMLAYRYHIIITKVQEHEKKNSKVILLLKRSYEVFY